MNSTHTNTVINSYMGTRKQLNEHSVPHQQKHYVMYTQSLQMLIWFTGPNPYYYTASGCLYGNSMQYYRLQLQQLPATGHPPGPAVVDYQALIGKRQVAEVISISTTAGREFLFGGGGNFRSGCLRLADPYSPSFLYSCHGNI